MKLTFWSWLGMLTVTEVIGYGYPLARQRIAYVEASDGKRWAVPLHELQVVAE